ncbi:MAG: hypothetical protein IPJ55_08985 [Chloracidobacterium sp.]|nr:hypothetical protein [Chloracidobacterium sp.]
MIDQGTDPTFFRTLLQIGRQPSGTLSAIVKRQELSSSPWRIRRIRSIGGEFQKRRQDSIKQVRSPDAAGLKDRLKTRIGFATCRTKKTGSVFFYAFDPDGSFRTITHDPRFTLDIYRARTI